MATTALVTGASGFLGRNVAYLLRDHGYRVIASGRRRQELPAGTQHVVGDLAALPDAGLRFDVAVHCAALSSSWGPWREFAHANVAGTRSAFEAARRAGARRFVHISSPSIYAATRDQWALREDQVDERNRLNAYIRSKIAAEQLLRAERQPGDPEVVVLRPRGIIGAGDPSLVPRVLRAHARIGIPLFREGTNLTDLTSVHSVAAAAMAALDVPAAAGQVFNITNGDPRPFREVTDRLLEVRGLRPKYRSASPRVAYALGGAMERIAAVLPGKPEPPLTRYTVSTLAWTQTLDITRAREILGYAPVVSIDEALEEYRSA